MWNALGLTFTQPGGESMQAIVDGTLAVRLFQGFISRNAILCARLAQNGFTGPKNFLEGPWGYFHLYSRDQCDREALIGDLGKRFELCKTMFKSYPSCGATIASTDAILRLIREKGIGPENVARIDIRVMPYTHKLVGHPFKIGEKPTISAQFSIQYCVANALLRKDSKLRHFQEEAIRDPKIMELVRKIHVNADPALDSGKREFNLRTEMRATTTMGDVHQTVVDIPSGFPGNPLNRENLIERFRDAATHGDKSLSTERIEEIISVVDCLEDLNDIRNLIPLLSDQSE
jgi:2-methylcitrate dehydratase PrpD